MPKAKVTKVFYIALALVAVTVLIGAVLPEQFETVTGNINQFITEKFGWYYVMISTFMVLFCVFLILSPIGKLTLGKPGDKPEFSTVSWFAMLFSAGMGIGLVFWGASEPLSHYLAPPTAKPETDEAFREALRSTFFHWGFHAWAIYGIVALGLAYFQFRKGEPGLISRTLRPILGNRVDGMIGTIIDVLAVFATVVGVAVSLGMGAQQINGGLHYLFGIPNTFWVKVIIVIIVTILFLMSAWSGLSKGIQYLSNLNLIFAGLLLFAVLFVGPTILIMNMFSTSVGNLLENFVYMSFDVAPLNEVKKDWMSSWTIYYWGWWMSWSPFVGIFIARVSKGRTVREFLLGVLLVPALLSFFWFSVFGTTAIETVKKVPGIGEMVVETQLFAIFNEMPMGIGLSLLALLLICTFFVTSADSATFVLGMQSTHGSLNPSNKIKVIWGLAQSLIALVLIYAGGLNALQSAAIIVAFPFSFVLLGMMFAFYKDANKERLHLGLTLTPHKRFRRKEE
ncbi:BCCT family transporter [Macrococcus hajekii]|uniref:BCCT family transporter n=1 Tax=Macrococcus hajekii TaxID=198482 RepID=A0A4R6BML7_9STAP|nr:BCCT family transporter [Macrococcus hajekii]TDM03079.1 BCCT family transporter [Macrococcus hajekii]GGB06376.1 glycine/betaine ABC transporter [Macrococcus hajekii]